MQILLIDDDRDSLENLGILLEKKGFTSMRFTDPRKALLAARENDFKIVVTDHEMPHMNGLVVLRKIREIASSIPVIIMSACPDSSMDQMSLDTGGNCTFFDKPLDLNLFMGTLMKIRDELKEAEE